jgi:hypothetical protein
MWSWPRRLIRGVAWAQFSMSAIFPSREIASRLVLVPAQFLIVGIRCGHH